MGLRYWLEAPPPAPLDEQCPPDAYSRCSLLLTLLQHQVAPSIARRELYAATLHCSICKRHWCAGTIEYEGEFNWHVFPCDREGEFWPPVYQGEKRLHTEFENTRYSSPDDIVVEPPGRGHYAAHRYSGK